MSKPETTEKMFEVRIARLEKYLQREGHEITKYDGMVDLAALAGWMMGYPRAWLNQLWEASATPSSRKPRKRS
jgi:hypothetical protein